MISADDKKIIVESIALEFHGQYDGAKKNLICDCPFCGKRAKFGLYVGPETEKKKVLSSHCFSCGVSFKDVNFMLMKIGRVDLMIKATASLDEKLDDTLFVLDKEVEIDDSLDIVELPDFYRRVFKHSYLSMRGFCFDDFDYFPVGITAGLNWRFDDYVIFPIVDEGDCVGYVARHLWSKGMIDDHNRKAKRRGEYLIRRFNNSIENGFSKLLYNYDSVVKGKTDTVIVAEGIFDVVAINRKLDLYDREDISVVATFGKKFSLVQIYKLQQKGVKTIVLAYDGDAVNAIKMIAAELLVYFNVMIADITDTSKDWDDLDECEVRGVFDNLKSVIQYKLTRI